MLHKPDYNLYQTRTLCRVTVARKTLNTYSHDHTIQQQILWLAEKYPQTFHIHTLQMAAAWRFGQLYTYKQVRDALYRLRVSGVPVRHIGLGWYSWPELLSMVKPLNSGAPLQLVA